MVTSSHFAMVMYCNQCDYATSILGKVNLYFEVFSEVTISCYLYIYIYIYGKIFLKRDRACQSGFWEILRDFEGF